MADTILQERDVVRYEDGLAIVRFAGEVEFAKGVWVGLELSNANGDSNGTKEGKTYFECIEKHGIFVPSKQIVKKIHAEEILKKFVNAQAKHKAEMVRLKEKMIALKTENDRLRETYPPRIDDMIFLVVDEAAILAMGCDKETILSAWSEHVGMDAEGTRDMSERDLKQNVALCCFKICDKSGDGFVDMEEAIGMYKLIMDADMPGFAAKDNAREMLEEADTQDANGKAGSDGKLSFQEWMDFFSFDLQINMRKENVVDVILETVDENMLLEMGVTREQLGKLWAEVMDRDADETRGMAAGALKRGVAECCFKAADKSGDGKISLKEAKGLYRAIMDGDMPTYMVDDAGKELLQDADANADGVISYIEWLEYFSYSADTDMKAEVEGEKLFKEILILVDVNHDQVVDLEEFSAVYPVATSTFFNSLDLNNNKTLEIHEFKQMFLQADGTMDGEEMQKMKAELESVMFTEQFNTLMTLTDSNSDGKISQSEFEKIFPTVTQQFFKILDLDKDGVLDKVEFREVFVLADGSLDHERIKECVDVFRTPYEKKLDELFELLDVDAIDGVLTLKEFSASYPNMSSDSSMQSLLTFIDTDKNGVLNKSEIAQFLPSMPQVLGVLKYLESRDIILKAFYEVVSEKYCERIEVKPKKTMETWRSVTGIMTPMHARALPQWRRTQMSAKVIFFLSDKSGDVSVDLAIAKSMYKEIMKKDNPDWADKDDNISLTYDEWLPCFAIDKLLEDQEAIDQGITRIFEILDSDVTDGKISPEELKLAYPKMANDVWENMLKTFDENNNLQLEKEEFKKTFNSADSVGQLLSQLEAQIEIADTVIYRVIDEATILQMGAKRRDIIQLWGQEYGINIEKAQKLPKINLKIQVAKLCFKLADKSGDGFVDIKEAKQLYRHIMDRDMPSMGADDNAEELVADADLNEDGKLSFEEFIKYFAFELKLQEKRIEKILGISFSKKEEEVKAA